MEKGFNFWGLSDISRAYNFEDKRKSKKHYLEYMLLRTMSMFEYEGLPDTMPKRALETYTQMNGHCAIIQHEGNLYCLFGSWGGYPDAYYLPTKYVISNPYLNIGKEYTINEDCIIFQNDSLFRGLLPLFSRYASLLVENDISMKMCDINARIVAIIEAQDDKTKASAIQYLKDVKDGKQGIIASTAFLDGLRTQPYGTTTQSNSLTDLIEFHQYLKASWFNEIGLQANYNMKRESINSDEAQLNDDMLLPLVDDMLQCRKEACERINEMFGTSISVRLASAWEDNRLELEMMQESLDSEYSENDPETEEESEPETEEESEPETEEESEPETEEEESEPETEEEESEPETEEEESEPETEEEESEPETEEEESEPEISNEMEINIMIGGEIEDDPTKDDE